MNQKIILFSYNDSGYVIIKGKKEFFVSCNELKNDSNCD